MSSIYIYWDESHLWGLLIWRALKAFGLPHRLVRAKEISQGLLSRKPPAALVVPGGLARRKFELLGKDGVREIRDYVSHGGVYFGFCGGAGLGLSGRHGLGLCPWKRRAFTDRLQHAMSGHMRVRPALDSSLIPPSLGASPLLPVWWPARFETSPEGEVNILAAYEAPGPDFWVADIPLQSIPRGALGDLETIYGLSIWPQFMVDQPCLVEGGYGQGRYVLSYTHLETPASRDANLWLAHLIRELTGLATHDGAALTPAWNLESLPRRWNDADGGQDLALAKAGLEASIREGMEELLFFRRNSWLLGWRRGIPGASLNALYSMVCQAQSVPPCSEAREYWREHAPQFLETLELFRYGLTGYLLSERLAMTTSGTANTIPESVLSEQRMALFGSRMDHGGIFAELLGVMDELLYLTLTGHGE
ncbi:MAG: biotin--protein ligase [Proteobacteria bacterium]|nr:biotin--protein ligase [Pseudomonadota bacterium]